ncbi:hypothetical protein PG996_013394 [Apiospora saccharicola]|uniref:DNA (cytosine-5-)-methyltransferase n=1 Tax=Apiospora saccharicola TaxID=335842 RepID=A0ABR1U806_9PEZI
MARRFFIPDDANVIDLDGDDDDEKILHEVEMVIDLTSDDDGHRPFPNPALLLNPQRGENLILHNGFYIHIGDHVEVVPVADSLEAQFLRVTTIGGGFIRGLPLTRARRLNGMLHKKRNEVCLIIDTAHGDLRLEEEQATVNVPLQHVVKPRDLIYTNAHYPAHKNRLAEGESVLPAEENGRLVCRWKYKRVWLNLNKRQEGKPSKESALFHLGAEDVTDPKYRVSDRKRYHNWRRDSIEETLGVWASNPNGRGQRYSFGDLFCGAGGASSGGRRAGLDVRMGCDKDKAACNTYEANFPLTELLEMDINTVLTSGAFGRLPKLDIVHLSPPCQTLSPAHTRVGRNDQENDAALFAVHDIVPQARARVFTMEETFGIMAQKHEEFFRKLIQCFTVWNYSVRWTVVDLRNWGVPMRRLRFLMIVSCPGEPLPEFPKNTHAENGADGLKPWVTYDNSHVVLLNDILQPQFPRWNPNIVLSRTITCAGTQGGKAGDYHHDGKRKWTCRELATLASFPTNYRFTGQITAQKRQIGNVFPLRLPMERIDQARRRQAPVQAMVVDVDDDGNNIIVIDDDDDDDVIMLG